MNLKHGIATQNITGQGSTIDALEQPGLNKSKEEYYFFALILCISKYFNDNSITALD